MRQHETERRIARRPSQSVPPSHASPRVLHRGDEGVGRLVVLEAEEHLVEHDLVQDLAARQLRERRRELARPRARLLDELRDAGAAERAQRGVGREAAGAARVLRRPVERVAARLGLAVA